MPRSTSLLLGLALGLGFGCGKLTRGPKAEAAGKVGQGATSINHPLYLLRAGGPHCVVGLTNWPASSKVSLARVDSVYDTVTFKLRNGEPHAILLWNVRVQVRSQGKGTDGLGWDTVDDDYPVRIGDINSAGCAPGASVRFQVRQPAGSPWRVCILYSTDWADTGRSYSGNYEAIGPELQD